MLSTHGTEQGRVLIRLPDDALLGRELRTYLQTEAYVKTKPTATLPDTAKRILRDRSEDNRTRRARILTSLESILADASYFVSGKKLEIASTNPKVALSEALEYLIQNAYPKMGDIQHLHSNALQEIQSTLRANDVEQVTLAIATPEANTKALDDLREYIRLCTMTNKQLVLRELIDKRYGGRPYGWPELEVVLLVARLAVLKEINLLVNYSPLSMEQAYDHLTSNSKQRKVIITQRESADGDVIKKAQALGKELFAQQGPSSEDGLFNFLKDQVSSWDSSLAAYEPLAKTGNYPGIKEIQTPRDDLRKFVEESDSLTFSQTFHWATKTSYWISAKTSTNSRIFISIRSTAGRPCAPPSANSRRTACSWRPIPTVAPALARMEEIQAAPRPYNLLHEVAALIHTARTANDQLVSDARGPALSRDPEPPRFHRQRARQRFCRLGSAQDGLQRTKQATRSRHQSDQHCTHRTGTADR